MTKTQNMLIAKLNNYFNHKDDYNYSTTMERAKKDIRFEKFISTISIDRLVNSSRDLGKYKYRF